MIATRLSHDEVGHPPDRFLESQDIVQKERRKHSQERAHIVCGFIRRHKRPPLSASLGDFTRSVHYDNLPMTCSILSRSVTWVNGFTR